MPIYLILLFFQQKCRDDTVFCDIILSQKQIDDNGEYLALMKKNCAGLMGNC